MLFDNKKIMIIGTQKAALDNLYDYYKQNKKVKVFKYNIKNFNKTEINKKIKSFKTKSFTSLIKLSKTHELVIGSSASKLEINIVNFLNLNEINFYYYIDSITNISKRFNGIDVLPNNIITINEIIIKEIKKILKSKEKKNILNLDMPYQNFLYKKYGNLKRLNKNILYISSYLGIKKELKNITFLLDRLNSNEKLYICIHPREVITQWKNFFKKDNRIKIFKKKIFYGSKSIKYVFGISTMGLINFKFAGFNVRYFKNNFVNKDLFLKLYKKYNIQGI